VAHSVSQADAGISDVGMLIKLIDAVPTSLAVASKWWLPFITLLAVAPIVHLDLLFLYFFLPRPL